MKMNLVMEIRDAPGQLVSVLDPIRGLGANIVTVIHKRDEKNEHGNIPVQLTLEGEKNNLNRVITKFKELGFSILEIDGQVNKEIISSILIGHLVDKDIQDTVDKINNLEGAVVTEFNIQLNGESESAALINIEADAGMDEVILEKLAEISNEKEFLMINNV